MTKTKLRVGDTVNVHFYCADFDKKENWAGFSGVIRKNYENSVLLDVSHSSELTRQQIKATHTGLIVVGKKHIDGKVKDGDPIYAESFLPRNKNKVIQGKNKARKEKYRRLGDQLRALANRGYTMAQASHELGISASLLAAARRGRDIDTRPHFHLQWLKPDGSIEYIDKIDTARKRHIIKYAFQGEEKNEWGIFRSGNWFEAEDGTIKPSESTEASNAWRR